MSILDDLYKTKKLRKEGLPANDDLEQKANELEKKLFIKKVSNVLQLYTKKNVK